MITVTSVAIIGLGLVGGSLLRRLAVSHDVRGYDADPATRSAVAMAGFTMRPSLAQAVADAELVVLATPFPTFAALLPEVAAAVGPGTLLTDVASVKAPVGALARTLAPELCYVGGHPMAGTEWSGFAASDSNLFGGAPWVLCLEPDTDLSRWLTLARLLTEIGARVVPATAAGHDAAVARISHLPHVLATVLAGIGADGGDLALKLAAASFRDGTRVAGTRPELAAAMCDANRAALTEALDAALDRLAEARASLAVGASLTGFFATGEAARRRWVATGMGGADVDLGPTSATLAADLLELGRSGGHLTAARDGGLLAWRPEG